MNREEAMAGLGDGRWEVRLQSALWLHRSRELGAAQAVVPLTRDPKRRVRQFATYMVGRRREGDEAFADALPLLMERIYQDTSPRVRRLALQVLAYDHAHPDLCGFFEKLLDTETDPKLHRLAGIGLWLSQRAER